MPSHNFHRELMSDVELIKTLNELFDSHEQSCGARIKSINPLNRPDDQGCNWRIREIDHGPNLAQEYQVLAENILNEAQKHYNLIH